MRGYAAIAAISILAGWIFGCSGDGDGDGSALDAGAPTTDGVVQSVSGTAEALAGADADSGSLTLDVFHGDRAVNLKIKLEITAAGVSEKGEGNQEFNLAPGLYSASISYREAEHLEPSTGGLQGLKVTGGATTRYTVMLDAPVGFLDMRFNGPAVGQAPPVPLSAQVSLSVYETGTTTQAVWKGQAGESIALPAGTYDIKATYDGGAAFPVVEWFRGVEVAGGLAKTRRDVTLEMESSGVRVDAFNFSRDINAETAVFFFNPGADATQAVAKASGVAGQAIEVEAGTYDVWVIYKPSMDLRGDRVLRDFVVSDSGGLRLQVDLEMELGRLKISVLDGEEDVSDRVDIQAKRAGADAVAASALIDVVGVGDHVVPPGTYDIYLTYNPLTGKKRKASFEGIDITNGSLWEQTFNARDEAWVAAGVQRPQSPLRPIAWEELEAGDDDSAAGDDDSAAGDDDSAASPPAEDGAGEAPAEGGGGEGGEAPAEGAEEPPDASGEAAAPAEDAVPAEEADPVEEAAPEPPPSE